jgi:exodeoxyribonuclease V alpha subunit
MTAFGSALESADFTALDVHFAQLMTRLGGCQDPAVALAAALASRATANGDVCVHLADFAAASPVPAGEGTKVSKDERHHVPLPPGEGVRARETAPRAKRAQSRAEAIRARQSVLPLFDDDAAELPHPHPSPGGRRAVLPTGDPPVTLTSGEGARVREEDQHFPLTPGEERVRENSALLMTTAPRLDDWLALLRRSSVVGRPGEFRPLILDDHGRLYLYRYWDYETRLADDLLARAVDIEHVDEALLMAGLARYFPDPRDAGQKHAAAMAVLRRLCVISGGPGTGKTTTVVKILALIAEQARGGRLSIALAAPTGKAAARVQDAVRGALDRLRLEPDVRAAMPDEAYTLHRLLGARPDSVYYRYNRANPLPLDVLVVDEASMADLALAAKLLDALPPQARLILLGDKDQLASVEAGAVLGDICAQSGITDEFARRLAAITDKPAASAPLSPRERGRGEGDGAPLSNSIAILTRSYRFGAGSGIGTLARLVNEGLGGEALDLLREGSHSDIAWRTIGPRELGAALSAYAVEHLRAYADAVRFGEPPHEIFARFSAFRVLCAHRTGLFGVAAVNRIIEDALDDARLIDLREPWYPGRPVMIARNDYNLRLFNGDIGITLPDPDAEGRLKVCFRGGESASGAGVRWIAPTRLPEHETVYAMTIHKSQGSEFGRVLMILPSETSPILTRELVYTGVTRALEHVEIWGTEATFAEAVERRLVRASALRDRLWGFARG